jgi:hypothetical protein
LKLAQIVITRKDKNTLKVTLFNKKECVASDEHSDAEAAKVIAEAIAQLNTIPSWEDA